jgi:GNAT superfamily N-acetyltransferase
MDYKSLSNSTTEEVCAAFNDAFSEYEVPIQMSLEKFIRVGQRRGADYAISLGAYAANRLTGFVVNAGGLWKGKNTIYDCFTGVTKDYQRKGIATQMLDKSFSNSKKLGFENYLLEVLQTNTKAYELYLAKGFKVIRGFDVYRCEVDQLKISQKLTGDRTIKITKDAEDIDWTLFKSFWDITPSWQNSIASIKRTWEDFEVFRAYDQETCIGYLLLEAKTGDIPQFAVHKAYRKKGIAASLIKRAAENRHEKYRLSFVNIDSTYTPNCNLLKKLGARLAVRQYEMLKVLQ